MKCLTVLIAVALMPFAAAASPPPVSHTAAMPATSAKFLQPAQIQWGDAPPALPKGAQAIVLSGNPNASGAFVLRLKAPAGYKVAMHWHPSDEQVTVIEGDFTLSMDDGSRPHQLSAGSFALMPAKMHHAGSTQAGTILQVSGIGPFEINYINPKDDPRHHAAAK